MPKTEDTIFPEALSTADRLNGVEWRGSARWYAGAYRTWEDDGTGWSEWKGMRKEDIDPTQILESLGGKPLAGNLVFFLEKKRGKWSIEVVSVALGGLKREPFEPDEYWATKPSCAVATSANPLAVPNASKTSGSPSDGLPNDQNYTKLIEDLVSENAKSWLMNRFVSGSAKNPTVISRDSAGRPSKLTAQYVFDGFSGRSPGTVTLTFSDGLPACLYFFDYPTTCRTPSRAIVTAYAEGQYTNDRIRQAEKENAEQEAAAVAEQVKQREAQTAELERRRQEAALRQQATASVVPPPVSTKANSVVLRRGLYVCPGAVLEDDGRRKLVIKVATRIQDAEAGTGRFRLEGLYNIYRFKSGPPPQQSCSQP